MRRVTLVKKRLVPNKGDRAQLMPFGDVHWGASTCQTEFSLERLDFALKTKMYVLGMGD